jgi:hypothetical protein
MSKSRSKDMKLDPGTFGGSPACHILADMMNRDMIAIKEKHRVLSIINRATTEFKVISALDSPFREKFLTLSRDQFIISIAKNAFDYPEVFVNHLRNVIHYHYKRFLKEEA